MAARPIQCCLEHSYSCMQPSSSVRDRTDTTRQEEITRSPAVEAYTWPLGHRRDVDGDVLGWLLKRPSNMRVYLRDGSAQTILRAATEDATFHLTQSDTGPTSSSADPITLSV